MTSRDISVLIAAFFLFCGMSPTRGQVQPSVKTLPVPSKMMPMAVGSVGTQALVGPTIQGRDILAGHTGINLNVRILPKGQFHRFTNFQQGKPYTALVATSTVILQEAPNIAFNCVNFPQSTHEINQGNTPTLFVFANEEGCVGLPRKDLPIRATRYSENNITGWYIEIDEFRNNTYSMKALLID